MDADEMGLTDEVMDDGDIPDLEPIWDADAGHSQQQQQQQQQVSEDDLADDLVRAIDHLSIEGGGDSEDVAMQLADNSAARQRLAAMVADRTDFAAMVERWRAKVVFDRPAVKRLYNVVKEINVALPEDEAGWKAACEKVWAPRMCDRIMACDPSAKKAHVADSYQKFFEWMTANEEAFCHNKYNVAWVDPRMEANYSFRELHHVAPFGVGYDYAVLVAASSQNSSAHSNDWRVYCAPINSVEPRYVNRSSRAEYERMEAKKDNQWLGNHKRNTVAVYSRSPIPPSQRPAHGVVHGDHVSIVWTEVKTPADLRETLPPYHDAIRIYKLPQLTKESRIDILSPTEVVTHYDLYYPYLVFACDGSYLADLPWVTRCANWREYAPLATAPGLSKGQIIMTVNIATNRIRRGFGSEGMVTCLSISPRQTSPHERNWPESDLRVYWSVDPQGDREMDGLVLSSLILPPDPPDDVVTRRLARNPDQELLDKATGSGPIYVSPANQAPVAIHAYQPTGCLVQVAPDNVSTVVPAWGIFEKDEIYYQRDVQILDMAICANVAATVLPDYVVRFSQVRPADTRDAFKPLGIFDMKGEVEKIYEGSAKGIPLSRKVYYKALWSSAARWVVQFSDGTLCFLEAMTIEEQRRHYDVLKKLHEMKEDQVKVINMTQRKVMQAAKLDDDDAVPAAAAVATTTAVVSEEGAGTSDEKGKAPMSE